MPFYFWETSTILFQTYASFKKPDLSKRQTDSLPSVLLYLFHILLNKRSNFTYSSLTFQTQQHRIRKDGHNTLFLSYQSGITIFSG